MALRGKSRKVVFKGIRYAIAGVSMIVVVPVMILGYVGRGIENFVSRAEPVLLNAARKINKRITAWEENCPEHTVEVLKSE